MMRKIQNTTNKCDTLRVPSPPSPSPPHQCGVWASALPAGVVEEAEQDVEQLEGQLHQEAEVCWGRQHRQSDTGLLFFNTPHIITK
ncbi:hypothetical protein E2C01_051156 [Portunus trituberculatus]|uniref:Uncharacterized protein n=1 Tax=Portunus trituberculatus TaxID=210409 RepID=A0A5B7GAU1_PORTR|nr:hypothetical protein [Portunus trituberculatus]